MLLGKRHQGAGIGFPAERAEIVRVGIASISPVAWDLLDDARALQVLNRCSPALQRLQVFAGELGQDGLGVGGGVQVGDRLIEAA